MGISKDQFRDNVDVFVDYDFEEVMFRFEAGCRRFFRKFYGESEEDEVPHDNHLLNDALLYGDEIDSRAYRVGKPKG